jgi:hypothetical protein
MRTIYIISATQVVTSESHPEGVFSNVTDYPKNIDTRDYNGSDELALIVAEADYADRVKQLSLANNPNRTMWTVTLERSDGRQFQKKTHGAFPVEPEHEPETL